MRGPLGEDPGRLALQPALHGVADLLFAGIARQGDEQERRRRGGAGSRREHERGLTGPALAGRGDDDGQRPAEIVDRGAVAPDDAARREPGRALALLGEPGS